MSKQTKKLDGSLLIFNGHIYVEKNVFADSMLIGEDGIIKAVGAYEEIVDKYGYPDAVLDAKYLTIVPGFNDSHLHLLNTGISLNAVKLKTAKSIVDVINLGRQYLIDHPSATGSVIYGMGWNQSNFKENRLLNRDDLDKISTEHPVIFERVCGHILTCNSKALEMAGIDENTPPTEGGALDKDQNGRLTGVVRENAREQILRLMSDPPVEEKIRLIQSAVDYANSLGITSVQTCDVRSRDWRSTLEAYDRFFSESEVPLIRVNHQFNFQKVEPLIEFLASERSRRRNDPFHQLGALKLFSDGSLGARTALLRRPYNDDPGNKGIATLTEKEIEELTKQAQDSGFPTVVHAIGDGAIENVLNAFEKVLKPDNPLRCGLVHVQITDRPLLERIAWQNILAFVQPIFLQYDSTIVQDRVGEELASTSYNFRTLKGLGVHTSFGTDSPIEDMNPLQNIYCAVTRQRMHERNEPYNPAEGMTVEEAIDAYTYEGAYATGESSRKGRIKPGYVADLAFLDRDIFTPDPEVLLETKVKGTMVNGRTVFWQSSFS